MTEDTFLSRQQVKLKEIKFKTSAKNQYGINSFHRLHNLIQEKQSLLSIIETVSPWSLLKNKENICIWYLKTKNSNSLHLSEWYIIMNII